jgi:hypothetical protein
MTTVTNTQVQALYIAYFNRPADFLGLPFTVEAANKVGLIAVADNFSKSPEYTSLFANKSTVEIIDTIYINLFGRHAEPGGLKFWGTLLENGTITVGNVALNIMNGAMDGPDNSDKVAITSKIAAADSFYAALDTSSEIIGYNGAAAASVVKTWLSAITTPATLAAATTDAALLAVTNAASAAHEAAVNPGKAFTLTASIDALANFTGTSGGDSFVAAPGTLTVLDSLDGSAGIDTLTAVDIAPAGSPFVVGFGATVANIEVAQLTSVSNSVIANVSGWKGLTSVEVVSSGGETITAAATTAVNSTDAGLVNGTISIKGGSNVNVSALGVTTGGSVSVKGSVGAVVVDVEGVAVDVAPSGSGSVISVTGGRTVEVTESVVNENLSGATYTQGAVNVTGDVTTTSVTVKQAAAVAAVAASLGVDGVGGIGQGKVVIADAHASSATLANTIAAVSLTGFGASSTIASNALTTLSLTDSASDIIVTDAATAHQTSLGLTVRGLTAGASVTDDTIKTLNITASGAASEFTAAGAALVTVTIDGDKAVKIGSIEGVTSVTSTNTAGVTTTLNTASTGVFGSGADVITLGANATKAITLGAGNDTAIVAGLGVGGSVDGGAGFNTLSMSSAAAAAATPSFAAAVTNFQGLTLTAAGSETINVAALGAYSTVTTAGATALTLTNMADSATLALTGAGTAYTVNEKNALANTSNDVTISLTSEVSTAFGSVTATDTELVKVVVKDSSKTPDGSVADTLTVTGDAVKAITVSGNAHITLTAASTELATLDGTLLVTTGKGASDTGLNWTSGVLAHAASIQGSATGGDVLDAHLATKAVSLTVFGGTNSLTGSATAVNTLSGAAGADTIVGGGVADVIVGGGGKDAITGGGGADLITVSGITSTVVQGAGDSGANTATTIQTSDLTSTFDVIKGIAAGDTIDLSGFAVGSTLVLAGSDLAAADNSVVFTTGNYDEAAGTFTFAANGHDTQVTYDTDAVSGAGHIAGESIILVGFHSAATSALSLGIVTLA